MKRCLLKEISNSPESLKGPGRPVSVRYFRKLVHEGKQEPALRACSTLGLVCAFGTLKLLLVAGSDRVDPAIGV